MILLFEGFLKRMIRRRRDPYAPWLQVVRDMEEQKRKLDDAIKNLQKAEDDIRSELFKHLPKERQEEILKKQEENRKEIEKQKKELEAKHKEFDPYGEEEWTDNPIKEWDWLDEEEDEEDVMRKRLDTVSKAKNKIKKFAGYDEEE